MPSSLKTRLRNGAKCLNGWSLIPDAVAAEILAQSGWDSITFDLQHGLHDYASALACMQATQAYPVTSLVRVPSNEPGIIGKVLDAGAGGIICPMVNTAGEASALVRACFYPPQGQRSNGPVRGAAYGGPTPYHESANNEILVLPQIETGEAVENIDVILDVKGVSGIYVGPSDLGLSLGLPPILDREEAEIMAIYKKLLAAVAKRGLFAAIHTATPVYAARMASMGFSLITVGADSAFLSAAARQAISSTRELAGWGRDENV